MDKGYIILNYGQLLIPFEKCRYTRPIFSEQIFFILAL
jgi:hypothetical protein